MSDQEQLIEDIFIKEFSHIVLPPNDEPYQFTSFNEFEEFLKNGYDFWATLQKSKYLPEVLRIFSSAINLIPSLKSQSEQGSIRNILREIKNGLNNKLLIPHNSKYAQFIKRIYDINPKSADAAYFFIFHKSLLNTNELDNFYGIISAYEFVRTSDISLEEKYNSERLDKLGADYKKEIARAHEEYDKLFALFKEQIINSKADFDAITKQYSDKLDSDNKLFEDKMKIWHDKISELEIIYDEKLMLAKPAEYWEELRKDYDSKGHNWKLYAILSATLFVGILIFLLFTFPGWLKGPFRIDQLKGVIIFTVLVSVFTYIIHLFVKLSTSAFHLSRDAEERRQLTYLFLSLMKEGKLEPKEREIVFQSLFSRADTGLLKNDGAPTMPTTSNALTELLSKIKL